MGCGSSTPDKGDRDRSYQIDKQIEEDSKKFQKECKILLLGAFSVPLPPLSPSSPSPFPLDLSFWRARDGMASVEWIVQGFGRAWKELGELDGGAATLVGQDFEEGQTDDSFEADSATHPP